MDPGDISVNSPVGQALLGRKVGEAVAVELPGGRTTELLLRGIESSPTAPPDRV
jgi:transcription elongation GreA/GreB family factor